jgi:hypothetical protein
LQMRICKGFKPDNTDAPSDIPGYSSFPLRFMAKLVAAKIAMMLHR